MKLFKTSIVLLALILSPISHATVIEHGSFVEDDVTNLDWLEGSFTIGLSIGEVSNMTNGGSLDGWRLASYSEVLALMSQFDGYSDSTGLSYGENYSISDLNSTEYGISQFADWFGRSLDHEEFGGHNHYYGYFESSTVGVDVLDIWDYMDPNEADYIDFWPLEEDSLTHFEVDTASLLVRDTVSVSEPSILILMGTGLIGLGLSRRKKSSLLS